VGTAPDTCVGNRAHAKRAVSRFSENQGSSTDYRRGDSEDGLDNLELRDTNEAAASSGEVRWHRGTPSRPHDQGAGRA
jgi:hypothetical protein